METCRLSCFCAIEMHSLHHQSLKISHWVTEVKFIFSEIDDGRYMYILRNNQSLFVIVDDFEDIWPKADRISTYLHNIIAWRPPCFQIHPDSDSEVEEEYEENRKEFKAALENMPKPSTDSG